MGTKKRKEAEERVKNKMKEIEVKARTQDSLYITQEEIKKVVNKLKRKKAPDREGWKNETVINGGKEMIESLYMMFNEIMKTGAIPIQWEKMKIKSIYKNKGSEKEMKNRRGIFITNIISKIFERTVLNKVSKNIDQDPFQNGGQKGRSSMDNWFLLMAIMEKNKRCNKDTYVIMADAEKCFDKLWLEDCLVDLRESGVREKEIIMIYNLNRKSRIEITTPFGKTEEIEVCDIVKQGTIFGPQLQCSYSIHFLYFTDYVIKSICFFLTNI